MNALLQRIAGRILSESQLQVTAVPEAVRALPNAPALLAGVAFKVWSVFNNSATADPRTASVFCRSKMLWELSLRAGRSHSALYTEQCSGCLNNSSALCKTLPVPQPKETCSRCCTRTHLLCQVHQSGCGGRLHRSSCLLSRLLQSGNGQGRNRGDICTAPGTRAEQRA